MGEGKFKIQKITNVFWLGRISPFIKSFLDKVPMDGMKYETVYSYFANTVQNGESMSQIGLRDAAELWVVFEDDSPVAFGHWFIRGLPYHGTAFCDFIYSWNTKKVPTGLLVKEFERFGVDHRCQLYMADVVNQRVFDVISSHAKQVGYNTVRGSHIKLIAFKEN